MIGGEPGLVFDGEEFGGGGCGELDVIEALAAPLAEMLIIEVEAVHGWFVDVAGFLGED